MSKENVLLGGVIAKDEQWRFPISDSVSYKMKKCIVYYEDEYFYQHIGFNPVSLSRAFYQNIAQKRIVSGASTITMQTIRMAKGTPQRSYSQKVLELILSTRLELRYSKNEILNYYLANAPYGGNVVGIEAAAWRYFRRMSNELSWGEAATLAVLPNAPSLIYPGKNQQKLKKKRNRLLLKLLANEVIDSFTYELAVEEPLPNRPNPLPQTAPHLLQLATKQFPGKRIESTISFPIQKHVQQVVNSHHSYLRKSEIHNMAAIVVDVKNSEVLAYIGNTSEKGDLHSNKVDVIQAPRSSGSILKPFLFEQMISEAQILPKMLLADIPFKDIKNYNENYDGAVPADEALARSLNIPATTLLSKFGLTKFKNVLLENQFNRFTKSSKHYGLSMIIGGGEVTLYELAQAYSNMAKKLSSPAMEQSAFTNISYLQGEQKKSKTIKAVEPYATYITLKALKEVVRPQSETGWQNFDGSQVSWKTGTSHGFKDAWAVAISPDYIVAVWVGNADGEGRPEMTGTKTAAPVLFDILDYFRPLAQFKEPKADMQSVKICRQSGYAFGEHCENYNLEIYPKFLSNFTPCPYHKTLFLDVTEQFRVNSNCYPVHQMKERKQLVLPPKIAWFYARKHPRYQSLPAYLPECNTSQKMIDLIYPKQLSSIFIPVDLRGNKQDVIFEAVHSNENSTLFWHLDGQFIEQTTEQHRIALQPNKGKHMLTITDQLGNELERDFVVVK